MRPVLMHSKDHLKDMPFKFIRHKSNQFRQALHMHNYIQIAYVVRGMCSHNFGDRVLMVGKGDLFVIPPWHPHSLATIDDKDTEFVLLDFMPGFLSEQLKPFSRSLFRHVVNHHQAGASEWLQPWLHISQEKQLLVEQLMQDIQDEFEAKEDGYEFSIQINVMKLLILIDREFRKSERLKHTQTQQRSNLQPFQDVMQFVQENYGQDIPLEQAADIANMTPAYFSHVFKKTTGQTFVEFLHEVRIERAKELIRQDAQSMTDICFQVGFRHLSHFIRTFKKRTGMTPTSYKKTTLNNEK